MQLVEGVPHLTYNSWQKLLTPFNPESDWRMDGRTDGWH